MSPREQRKRRGFLEHLRRQRAEQTGESPKFNRALDPGCGGVDVDEIVMLDDLTGMPED